MVLLVVGGVEVHSGPLVEQDKTDQTLKQIKIERERERERERSGLDWCSEERN